MRRVMVRYKVKPDRGDENVRLVQAVFAQLDRERPAGLQYASYRLGDGVSFVHIAEMPDGTNPLLGLDTFRAFTSEIDERCEERPATTVLATEIGSYRSA